MLPFYSSKVASTSPNYFHKSLFNVLNLFCYTNCLLRFSHFHMLTHSLKLSFNPSLVAVFFFPESSEKLEHKSKKWAEYFKKHFIFINEAKSLLAKLFCLQGNSWSPFLVAIRAMCSVSKKQLVIIQFPLCKEAMGVLWFLGGFSVDHVA